MTPTWQVLVGDVRARLAALPAGSVQCCVTSPPYWGLRDYVVDGQIGLEATPELYTAALVAVFGDVWRVLADDGVLWLNLGDSYTSAQSNNGGYSERSTLAGFTSPDTKGRTANEAGIRVRLDHGLKPKDLVGIPWRVAFALQADGWYLRSDVIWSKPNPMPESVTDRPTKSHEYVFLLAKAERYYYDAKAIAEDSVDPESYEGRRKRHTRSILAHDQGYDGHRTTMGLDGATYPTRNARSVWAITTQPYPDAHFATFPEALPERCIKAGSRLGDTVLDPFCGSGTTGQVAIQLGRSFVGVELNATYAEMARGRIGGAAPLFAVESELSVGAVDPHAGSTTECPRAADFLCRSEAP